MYVKVKIQDDKKATPAATSTVTYVNNILPSLFSSLEIYANETLINDSYMYPYRAMVENYLNYNKDAGATLLEAEGYFQDSTPQTLFATTDSSFFKRNQFARSANGIELAGKIHADICSNPTLMLPGVNFKFRFTRSKDEFALIKLSNEGEDKDKKYTVHIEEASLYVRRYQMLASLSLRNHQILQRGALIKYPIRKVNMRTFLIPKGVTTFSNNTLLNGVLPERFVLFMVDNSHASGGFDSNPFNFNDFDLDTLEVSTSNQMSKFPPIKMNYTAGSQELLKAYYLSMLGCTSNQSLDGFPVPLSQYKTQGNTLFVFDLRDASGTQTSQPLRSGSINIDFRFRKATDSAIDCFIYAEYSAMITVDKLLQVELEEPGASENYVEI